MYTNDYITLNASSLRGLLVLYKDLFLDEFVKDEMVLLELLNSRKKRLFFWKTRPFTTKEIQFHISNFRWWKEYYSERLESLITRCEWSKSPNGSGLVTLSERDFKDLILPDWSKILKPVLRNSIKGIERISVPA